MADFYLLPPRPAVGEEIARVVRAYLPGVRVTAADCVRLLEQVVESTRGRAFIVHREDLPDGEDVGSAVRDGFGATAGDRIVQVSLGAGSREPRVHVRPVEDTAVAVG